MARVSTGDQVHPLPCIAVKYGTFCFVNEKRHTFFSYNHHQHHHRTIIFSKKDKLLPSKHSEKVLYFGKNTNFTVSLLVK